MNSRPTRIDGIHRIRNQLIIKSNDLIQASDYRLPFQPYKLAKYCIAMLSQAGQRRLRVNIREYCQAIGLSLQTTNDRSIRKAALQLLQTRLVTSTQGLQRHTRIIDRVEIIDRQHIDVQLSEDFSSQIVFVPPPYTRYRFVNIAFLSSYYSIRLYEMCKSWQTRTSFAIGVEALRGKFMCGDRLATWQHFKARALLRPIEEINRLTDILVTIQYRRSGSRRVDSIAFQIRPKTPEQRDQVKSHIQRHIDARYGPSPSGPTRAPDDPGKKPRSRR